MITDLLAATLTTVNDWLKFAETKLTVLITVNGAAAFAAIQLLTIDRFPPYMGIAVLIYLILTGLAVVIALLGIVPQVQIRPHQPDATQHNSDNLLFYGHIAKYEPAEYLNRFCALVGQPVATATAYDTALAGQVVTNARICRTKYRIFSWAIRVSIYGVVALLEIVLLGLITPLY